MTDIQKYLELKKAVGEYLRLYQQEGDPEYEAALSRLREIYDQMED